MRKSETDIHPHKIYRRELARYNLLLSNIKAKLNIFFKQILDFM